MAEALVVSDAWTLIQENSDYVDYRQYVRDDDPGVYITVVLTLTSEGTAYVSIEQGIYKGWGGNNEEQTDSFDLPRAEAEALLGDPAGPEKLWQRSSITIKDLGDLV